MTETLPEAPPDKNFDKIYDQPKGYFDTEHDFIYSELASRLKEDCRKKGAGSIAEALAERVAFLYGHIRQKEAAQAAYAVKQAEANGQEPEGLAPFDHDRSYKETNQLWQSMAGQLAKMLEAPVSVDEIRAIVEAAFVEAINEATKDLQPEVRETILKAAANLTAE